MTDQIWRDAVIGHRLLQITTSNEGDIHRFVFDHGVLTHSFSEGHWYSEWTSDSAYSNWDWKPT
jgi:hypothetical protein